jgi:hypothetical protein
VADSFFLNFKHKWMESKARRTQKSRELLQERLWSNTKIPDGWLTPSIVAGLEQSAVRCCNAIQPERLLINMCGEWTRRSSENYNINAKDPYNHHADVFGGYGEYGGKNIKLGFDYSPLSWEQLCAVAYLQLEKHSDVHKARKRLQKVGIKTRWGSTTYNAAAEFNLYYLLNESNVAAIRKLAKEDWGVKTSEQSDEFDQVLDLHLKQNWGDETQRKKWSEQARPARWPLPKYNNNTHR